MIKKTAPFFCLAVMALPGVSTCLGQNPGPGDQPEQNRYELLVQYAKTNLELAKVELQYSKEENAKIRGVISKVAIERLRSNLAVAETQFQEASMASSGGLERVQLRHAEEKIRLAKLDLERGRKQGDGGGLISDLELQRLELKYELARLNLSLLQNPENFVTLLHHLEVKVNRMGEEILALDQRISRLEPVRGVLPKN